MILRTAGAADAGAICALWNRAIADTAVTFTTEARTVPAMAALIDARGPAFVLAEAADEGGGQGDGRLLGFATYGGFRAGPGYAATCEHSVFVAPDAQGSGIGRALMAALQTRARDDGMHVMVAAISGANPDAVGFHARLGFSQVGRLPETGRKFGQWLDLVLMQKIL